MKKLSVFLFLTFLLMLIFAACGEGNSTTTPDSTLASTVEETTTLPDTSTVPMDSSTADTTAAPDTTTVEETTTAAPETTTTVEETTTAAPETTTTVEETTTAAPETTTTVEETTTSAPETTEAPMTYTSANWMSAIADNTTLNMIAMPGTHDSGATKGGSVAQCQSLTIAQQLDAGVRYFDIRLRRINGVLKVYHGIIDQALTFEEVLTACYTFLDGNPSETLIMCIMEEGDASGTNDAFDVMVKSHIDANRDKWFTGGGIPQLGTVRGKINLMRRYGTSGAYGFNASSGWSDNTTFTLSTGSYKLSVQDYYQNESGEAKWQAVEAFFATMKPKANTYYLNNTSGYKPGLFSIPNIDTIRNFVNPKLIEYLKTSPDIVGIVATDFMTAEIAALIYELNFQ